MNLWLRLFCLVVSSIWRPRLDSTSGLSRLRFRVLPGDLDTSLHMNNGRYWTLMDLGRADLLIRSGLWRAVLRNRWTPVVNAGSIRFRRELRLFQPFALTTRILTWGETWLVIEHKLVSRSRDGAEVVNAVALVRVALYDRKARRFIPTERMFAAIGTQAEAPAPTPAVAAFLTAEAALKEAA